MKYFVSFFFLLAMNHEIFYTLSQWLACDKKIISKVHLLLGLSLSGAMNPAVISHWVGASLVRTTPIPRQGSPPGPP